MAFIATEDLHHTYRLEGGEKIAALREVDLSIERGEFVALIGPNGSGKSTLARHLNALLLPTAGRVWIDGLLTADRRHLWAVRKRVGMVFQNPDNQIVASTVEEDVAFGPENLAYPPAEIRRRVAEALRIVGLTNYRMSSPSKLSGGQKQLVAIAGALATGSDAIIFDEPTSMLDPAGRRRVMATIQKLNATQEMTVVLITQSMEEAALARRVLVMDAGRIVLGGSPQEVFGRAECLKALGLELPFAVDLASRLRERGVTLSTNCLPLTVEALAEALC